MMKEITPTELKNWIDTKKDFQLIDVREPYESDIASIGGENIPMANIMAEKERVRNNVPVVFYCRSGARSATVIKHLESCGSFTNLYNLKGGILAYADEVDPSLSKY
jgi:adenylyltransferase/sulfurtransferase